MKEKHPRDSNRREALTDFVIGSRVLGKGMSAEDLILVVY